MKKSQLIKLIQEQIKENYFEITPKGKILLEDIDLLMKQLDKFKVGRELENILYESERVKYMVEEIGFLYNFVVRNGKGYILSYKNAKQIFYDNYEKSISLLIKNGIIKSMAGY